MTWGRRGCLGRLAPHEMAASKTWDRRKGYSSPGQPQKPRSSPWRGGSGNHCERNGAPVLPALSHRGSGQPARPGPSAGEPKRWAFGLLYNNETDAPGTSLGASPWRPPASPPTRAAALACFQAGMPFYRAGPQPPWGQGAPGGLVGALRGLEHLATRRRPQRPARQIDRAHPFRVWGVYDIPDRTGALLGTWNPPVARRRFCAFNVNLGPAVGAETAKNSPVMEMAPCNDRRCEPARSAKWPSLWLGRPAAREYTAKVTTCNNVPAKWMTCAAPCRWMASSVRRTNASRRRGGGAGWQQGIRPPPGLREWRAARLKFIYRSNLRPSTAADYRGRIESFATRPPAAVVPTGIVRHSPTAVHPVRRYPFPGRRLRSERPLSRND